jgi:hypothetical protein
MPGSSTTPGCPHARHNAPVRVAFHVSNRVGAREEGLSQVNGWPARSPVNASLTPSQMPAHDSGALWFARPSVQRTCTTYSLPVLPAHLKNCSRLSQRVFLGGHKPSPERVAFNSGRFMRSNFGDVFDPTRETSFSTASVGSVSRAEPTNSRCCRYSELREKCRSRPTPVFEQHTETCWKQSFVLSPARPRRWEATAVWYAAECYRITSSARSSSD